MMRTRVALLLLLCPAAVVAQRPVEYEVAFPNAVHHEAEIAATFRDAPAGRPLEVWMSRSSPGRYALHEFAKNVYNVRATDGRGRVLRVTRPDPYRWSVAGHDGTVRFSYTLFADRADGTYSGIDNTHAHLNAPATFAWARGLERRPVQVTFRLPDPSWRIATQLVPTSVPERFSAPDLRYFLDSPVEISPHQLYSWTEQTTGGRSETIRLALHHQGTEEEARQYVEMAKRVVKEEEAIFGELPRFDFGTYTFLADYLPWVAGDGMEHRNSTVISSTRPLSTGAVANLGTLAHEFFHAWNIERIRPASLEPFDFTRANMSGALWFGEGFTSYYTDLPLKRAGVIELDEYARRIGRTVNTVVNGPGRRYFSPVEMSQQAPFVDAATSIDPTSQPNTFISYYTWGSALGLGLDLTLRQRFDRSLDDYMRAMWARFGRPQKDQTPQRPYTLDDLRRTLGEVAGDSAFARDFFRRYVEGREVVDYARLLEPAGLLLRPANAGRAWLGDAALRFEEGGPVVASAPRVGTPLYQAGVDIGATLTSLDGRSVASQSELTSLLAARRPGDSLPLTFTLRGQRFSRTVTLAPDPTLEIVPFEAAGRPATAEIRKFREEWLGGKGK